MLRQKPHATAGADCSTAQQSPAAERLWKPHVIQINQHKWKQEGDQNKACPGQHPARKTTCTCRSNREGTEPQRCTQTFHQRITTVDGCPAITTSSPQQDPAEDRKIVVPTHSVTAARAVTAGTDHRLLSRQSPHHNIGETADTGSSHSGPDQDQPLHRFRVLTVLPRIRSRGMNSSSGRRRGCSKTTLPTL